MSAEKKEEKITPNKTDYKVLVEQLLSLSAEFGACQDFLDEVGAITDKNKFRRVFERNFSEIVKKFDIDDYSYEVDKLERKVEDLKGEVNSLENELDDYKYRFGKVSTLTDEYKISHFIKHKDNYAEWELQLLFEKGKNLLQSNAIN